MPKEILVLPNDTKLRWAGVVPNLINYQFLKYNIVVIFSQCIGLLILSVPGSDPLTKYISFLCTVYLLSARQVYSSTIVRTCLLTCRYKLHRTSFRVEAFLQMAKYFLMFCSYFFF